MKWAIAGLANWFSQPHPALLVEHCLAGGLRNRATTRDAGESKIGCGQRWLPKSMAALGPLGGFLAMTSCRCIQMSPLGQPGRTKGHAEDAGGLFVIAPSPSVGVGELGAQHWVAPVDLVRPLGVDGLRS